MKIDKEEINKREQTEEEEWNSVKRWKKLMQKQTKKPHHDRKKDRNRN